jgi:meiotically up-regulated gene 157 (Mug157) protein
MLSVELAHLSSLLTVAERMNVANITGLASKARTMSTKIRNAIYEHAVFEHPKYGKVFAYEVDGV